ncbi:hypothetical protein F4677DRAFT_367985 [Hypoxylon crocopeplum]|nr:hypothetical protein F4677DRAFT_367985 [Hypoxylon crocopeplum]
MEIDLNPNYNETISSKSHNLIRRLRDLICLLEKERAIGEVTIPSTSVSDILDRFFLWCGNLGVLHKPTNNLSLDRRLADASEVRDQIFVNIADFNEAIEDLARIVVGNSPNRNIPSGDDDAPDNHDGGSDADISPMDEAHMNLELMAEAMKSLFRLGVLVRKSGRRDRFQRALQQSSSTFDESFDIDYVSQKYPKLNNAKCQWLSKRLGSAGAKRRQFIKYCREHKGRLDIHDNELRDGATEKLSSKATTFVHNVGSRSLDSTFETRDEDDAISITTATTTFNAETKLKLPSLAELSPSGDHFECPICFTLQSFETENSWKLV